jgi:small conductance mechanosensitive channel
LHSQSSVENGSEQRFTQPPQLHKKLIHLSIKALVLVMATWLCLYLVGLVGPYIGIKELHIQIAGSIATIIISLVVINAIRGLLQTTVVKISPHLSASISFFIAVTISLIAIISLMYQWNTNPESILVGGGVAAIIVGIGVSTIIGNMLSAVLMLTAFPARIGDSIHVVNDNIGGKIAEINFFFTRITTSEGAEYVVPNNAIVQGNVRITKDVPIYSLQLPFIEGDDIELKDSSTMYRGTVNRITANFTTLRHGPNNEYETILANRAIVAGNFVVIKKISGKNDAVTL